MKIYKMITDHKPDHCISCPISTLHICGKEHTEHPTSGAAYKVMVPDKRCVIRVHKEVV